MARLAVFTDTGTGDHVAFLIDNIVSVRPQGSYVRIFTVDGGYVDVSGTADAVWDKIEQSNVEVIIWVGP